MKNNENVRNLAVSLLILACLASPSWAGMAVSDTTSHLYLSKNLEEAVQQLETAMKQLELVQQSTDTIKKTYQEATAQYGRAKGLYDEIMRVKKFYDTTKRSMMGRYQKIKKFYELSENDPQKAIEGFVELIDDGFKDPRTTDPEEWKRILDKQFDFRQLALKEVIERGEESIEEMQRRLERVQELANQVDETVNPKDAQDLTNRLLSEILLVLQEQMAMNLQYQQTMAALKYKGVTENSIKKRQERLQALKANRERTRWEDEELESMGVTKTMSRQEIFEAVKSKNRNSIKIMDFGL